MADNNQDKDETDPDLDNIFQQAFRTGTNTNANLEHAEDSVWQAPSTETQRKNLQARAQTQRAACWAALALTTLFSAAAGALAFGQQNGWAGIDYHNAVPDLVQQELGKNPSADTAIIANYYNRQATEAENKDLLRLSVLAGLPLLFAAAGYTGLRHTRRMLDALPTLRRDI